MGRANFICLRELSRRESSAVSTPEGVPRLFDLVKSKDDSFRPAFFSVLQNTLVAKDLEQANRIAYGPRRWRVVTLDGQLIDVSGTMSGGGTRVARGGMSSKLGPSTSKEQVAKLEVDCEGLEHQFRHLQQRQQELQETLTTLSAQSPQIETAMQKIGLEIESLSRNLDDAERRVSELIAEQRSSSSHDNRISPLEKQIAQHKRSVEELRAETADVEAEIKELQNNIMQIGGVRLRGQKAKVDGLKEQIETLTEEISNAEVAKSKAEKQTDKNRKAFVEAEFEFRLASEELEELANEVTNQATGVSGLKQKVEEAQEVRSEKKIVERKSSKLMSITELRIKARGACDLERTT